MRGPTSLGSSFAKASALLAVLLRSDGTRPDTAGCVPRMVYFTTEQGAVAYAVAVAPPDVFDMLQSKEYLVEGSEGSEMIPIMLPHSFDWFEEFSRLKFCLPGESSGVSDPEAADPEAADPEGPMSQVEGIVFGQLMKRLTRLGLDTTQPEGCDDLVRDIFGARPIELLERDTGGDEVSVVYSGELKPEEVQNFLKHASKEWRTLFDPRPSLLLRPYFLWPAVAVGSTAGTMALYWAVQMLRHHYIKTAPITNSSILGIGNSSLNNTTANTPPSVDEATLGISNPLTETIGLLLKSTISSPTSGPRALGFPTSGFPTSSSPTSGSPTFGFPTSSSPTSGSPTSGFPASGFPTSGSPTSSSPTSGFPTSGSPISSSPTSGSPTFGFPTSSSPTSGSPTSGFPASGSPTSSSPTSGSPTFGFPTTALVTSRDLAVLKQPWRACFDREPDTYYAAPYWASKCHSDEGALGCLYDLEEEPDCYRYGGATGVDFTSLRQWAGSHNYACQVTTSCDDGYKAPRTLATMSLPAPPATAPVPNRDPAGLKEPFEACIKESIYTYTFFPASVAIDTCGRGQGALACLVKGCYRYGGATGIDFATLRQWLASDPEGMGCIVRTVCDDDYKAPQNLPER